MSQLKISYPVLATVIATCLAVGSGGAWVAGRPADPAPVTQTQDLKTGERLAALEASQKERDKMLDQRLEAIENQLLALNARLDRGFARRQ